MKTIDALVLE